MTEKTDYLHTGVKYMQPIFKTSIDGVEIKYEFCNDDQQNPNLCEVQQKLNDNEDRISAINADIDRLTNHSDGIDYALAVSCGIITGLIDSIFVGEWNFANAKAISNEKINREVIDFAKKKGYEGDRLDGAIRFLEKKFPLPGDSAWNGTGINLDIVNEKGIAEDVASKLLNSDVTAKTHHLDDFCHHPTLIGLICCVMVQFTGATMYSDKTGTYIDLPIIVNDYGNFVGKNPATKMFAGVINWFITVAKTMANRKGHLFSDMAGTSKTAGKGMGLPGAFLSTLKELSALPILKDTSFPENLRKAFHNGIGTGKSQVDLGAFNSLFEGASSQFDKRTEMAIAHELKRQALPVIINEALIRGIYFIRRFSDNLKEHKKLSEIDWKSVLPFRNRTVIRMLTISTSTLMAVDLGDATIRSAIKSSGNPAAFASNFILRVNFVGVGRCVVAIGVDVGMGINEENLRNKRMAIMSEQLHLMNAKIFYKQGEMWLEAKNAVESIEKTQAIMQKSVLFFTESVDAISDNLESVGEKMHRTPGLAEQGLDVLKWG